MDSSLQYQVVNVKGMKSEAMFLKKKIQSSRLPGNFGKKLLGMFCSSLLIRTKKTLR